MDAACHAKLGELETQHEAPDTVVTTQEGRWRAGVKSTTSSRMLTSLASHPTRAVALALPSIERSRRAPHGGVRA